MLITKESARIAIDKLNWPELFPYRPEVTLDIYHSSEFLHLHYKVKENCVRAVCDADKQRVWEDSCVEFFFKPQGSDCYYNLECTCIGKIYLCKGVDRHAREALPEKAYTSIKRECSLGTEAFGLIEAEQEWEVRLEIPAFVYGLESFDGCKGTANFYSCGDALPIKHYLSWAEIGTEKPDFHRPEYFAPIEFE